MPRFTYSLNRFLGLGIALATPAAAQLLITAPGFTVTDLADSTHESFTYLNTTTALTSFQAGGTPYIVGTTANQAYARRNAVNLLDWTTYPINTAGNTGTGDIDLVSINGIAFSAVLGPNAFGFAAPLALALSSANCRPPATLLNA